MSFDFDSSLYDFNTQKPSDIPVEATETVASDKKEPSQLPSPIPTSETPITTNLKIFVAGLSPQTTTPTLRQYFEKFGILSDAIVLFDSQSKSRLYGFVKFANHSDFIRVLKQDHVIDGKKVDVKRSDKDSKIVDKISKVYITNIPPTVTFLIGYRATSFGLF